jgi:flagellar hook protein FlgE
VLEAGMSVIGTATSGMIAATNRLEGVAKAAAPQSSEGAKEVDLAKEAAEIVAAKIEFQANAAVARTGSRTVGSLVDILA